MISKEEYDAFLEIDKTGAPDRYFETDAVIAEMCRSKFIEPIVTEVGRQSVFYRGFHILPLGRRAIEEYQTNLARDEREIQTLEIANKSNEISAEANNIAKGAKKISGYSLVVSIASGLIAVASILVAALT